MQNILIVVDMQNDFISGSLGSREAEAIVPLMQERIRSFDGKVLFTRDTHGEDYLTTQEGRRLPVKHCIRGTKGWEFEPSLESLCREDPIEKETFGSSRLALMLCDMDSKEHIASITLAGLCTDICVISNAMICRAFLPETEILVDASCCAGTTPENHQNALDAMKQCQIQIIV